MSSGTSPDPSTERAVERVFLCPECGGIGYAPKIHRCALGKHCPDDEPFIPLATLHRLAEDWEEAALTHRATADQLSGEERTRYRIRAAVYERCARLLRQAGSG